jgi:hypothetical protein
LTYNIVIHGFSYHISEQFHLQLATPSGTALNPVASMSGFIFRLDKRLQTLTMHIPDAMDKAKARNPPYYNADRSPVKKRIACHRSSYAQSEKYRIRVHDTVRCGIEKA